MNDDRNVEEIIRRNSRPLMPLPTGVDPILPLLLDIRVVLFDVYGTLFASGSGDIGSIPTETGRDCFVQAFSRSGMGKFSDVEGRRIRVIYEEAIRSSHEESRSRGIDVPEVDILSVWRSVLTTAGREGIAVPSSPSREELQILAVEYETLSNPVWPMPEMVMTVRQLADTGFPLGIISNAQFYTPLLFPALTGKSLSEIGFKKELCIWSFEEGRVKPSPHLFSLALSRIREPFDAKPEQVLFIGNDMLNDVASAAEAGFSTALFAGDSRSLRLREDDERCSGIRPDAVVTSLPQIAQISGKG